MVVVSSVEGSQGSRPRDLEPALTFIRQLDWSPDGRSILARGAVLSTTWGIDMIDAESGQAERIVRGQRVRWPRWSADGNAMFYVLRSRETVRNADNGSDRQVAVDQILRRDLSTSEASDDQEIHRVIVPTSIASFRLSPDGRQIGFHLETSTPDGTYEWSIQTKALSGGSPTTVLPESDPAWRVSGWEWTPDGKAILFVRATSNLMTEQREIWKLDLASGTIEFTGIVMPGIQTIAIDPTGTRIAFTAHTQAPSSHIHVLGNFLGETDFRRR